MGNKRTRLALADADKTANPVNAPAETPAPAPAKPKKKASQPWRIRPRARTGARLIISAYDAVTGEEITPLVAIDQDGIAPIAGARQALEAGGYAVNASAFSADGNLTPLSVLSEL